jgi:teichuronic acid exporter
LAKSLTDKTLSGLNWNLLNNYVNSITVTIIGVVLARLLTPQDFGLVGMVFVFTGLADLFATLGMGKSVIRFRNLNDDHIKTATTITMVSSILIFGVFYFASPLIANFYNEPRLISILRVLSTIFILKGINTVSYAQITKELDFKTIMLINISTSVIYGLVSSLMALLNFGVWSLVYGRIASQALAVVMSTYKYPVKLMPTLKKKEFKELMSTGTGISLSSILLYGSSNVDYLIVGKFINPFALGLYTRAFNLMTQSITRIAGGIYTVLFPAFASAQHDKQKLKKAYLRTIKTVSYFVFPVQAVLIIDADYVIKGLYGSKWVGAIPVFRILAFGGILRTTLSYSGALAQATGYIYKEAFQQLVYFLILGSGALIAVRFGIEGVAGAVVVSLIWMFLAQSGLALKIIESDWKEFTRSMIPGFVNLVFMSLINLIFIFFIEKYFYFLHNEFKLIAAVAVNIIVFLSIVVFMPYSIKGDTFDWLLEKYKKFIPSFFTRFYFSFNDRSRFLVEN